MGARTPEANDTSDRLQTQVIGNKADTGVQSSGTTASQTAMLKGVLDILCGTTGIATFPAAAIPANNVSLAEVIRKIYDLVASISVETSGTAGIASWPAGAAAGDGVSMCEALRYMSETVLAQLSGAAGIATFPAAAAPGDGVSLAEVIRKIYDLVNTLDIETTGTAGIATWPAGAAAADGVSLCEALRYMSETVLGQLSGTAGIATFPAAAAAADTVSLAEVVRYIQENGTDAILAQLSGAAGIATWPAGAAAADGVSLAEALRYMSETVLGQLSGAAGIATFPAAAAAADTVSLAEVVRYIQENGTDAILAQLSGAAGIASWPAGAAPADTVSLAEGLRWIAESQRAGDVFIVQKTVNQNTIVAAGAALTGVSSGGALVIEDFSAQVATAVDSVGHAAVVELYTDDTLGSASFATMAQAKLGANGGCDGKNATTFRKQVLGTGKKISVKATTEDVTSNADITFTFVLRRAAAGATVAAA